MFLNKVTSLINKLRYDMLNLVTLFVTSKQRNNNKKPFHEMSSANNLSNTSQTKTAALLQHQTSTLAEREANTRCSLLKLVVGLVRLSYVVWYGVRACVYRIEETKENIHKTRQNKMHDNKHDRPTKQMNERTR